MIAPNPADYRAAANLIRTGGLAKGVYRDHTTGAHCTVGALCEVTGLHYSHQLADRGLLEPLDQLLGQPYPGCGCSNCGSSFDRITSWNDLADTAEDDAILLLEQAAEKLEANR